MLIKIWNYALLKSVIIIISYDVNMIEMWMIFKEKSTPIIKSNWSESVLYLIIGINYLVDQTKLFLYSREC